MSAARPPEGANSLLQGQDHRPKRAPVSALPRLWRGWWLLAAWCCGVAQASVTATDDAGHVILLPAPAKRIISLAPHATELLFAAGAGARVVATVRYADYPDAARRLPRVGDANQLDLERLLALQPDLVVVWGHGNASEQIERLRALKLPLFFSEPRTLPQISSSLRRLGALAGTEPAAEQAAKAFDTELAALQQRHAQRPPLRVFFQVWHQPLMTVNDQHLIGDVIHLCGGVNVFGAQPQLVPTPSAEAVLAARPQVLVTSAGEDSPDGTMADGLSPWRGFKSFEPVARQQIVLLSADLISRPSPRILLAARALCEAMEGFRAKGATAR
jgi:iron complex transport system substrate-binding protein